MVHTGSGLVLLHQLEELVAPKNSRRELSSSAHGAREKGIKQLARPSVLLADDHPATLEIIAQILAQKFEILEKVKNGQEALDAALELQPDLVVLDISMPKISGIDVAKKLRKNNPDIKVVFVTVHCNPDFLSQALDAGGFGYVIKSTMGSELVRALNDALLGRRFISPMLFENT